MKGEWEIYTIGLVLGMSKRHRSVLREDTHTQICSCTGTYLEIGLMMRWFMKRQPLQIFLCKACSFLFFLFSPLSILLQKHAILLQSQSWNQRTVTIWVGIKCLKWRAIWNRIANLLAFQEKKKQNQNLSPPQEILWRENWHLLCLAGLLHQYADCGCSCRSWLFSVWMPDKRQLHMEVPDQAWFNIMCDFD